MSNTDDVGNKEQDPNDDKTETTDDKQTDDQSANATSPPAITTESLSKVKYKGGKKVVEKIVVEKVNYVRIDIKNEPVLPKLGKKDKVLEIPVYLHNPHTDPDIVRLEREDCYDFLTGLGDYVQQGSYSAKIAYIGPNRNMTYSVRMAKRSLVPNRNNWKIWLSPAVFWRNAPHSGLLKDPDFIQSCLRSDNFRVELTKDPPFQKKDVKAITYKRDENRILSLPFHMRYEYITNGVKSPLRRGEAEIILNKLNTEEIIARVEAKVWLESNKPVIAWLSQRIESDNAEESNLQTEKAEAAQ